jgi:ABC-type phosphate transport system substrate-binding protein
MVLLIFSDAVDNWQDFGPSFPNLAIAKCMRHGGSGTHQTLINAVFRGEAIVKNLTVGFPASQGDDANIGRSYVWHYKSSSDLTRDCVAYYAGGIGYVDADKIMFRSKIEPTKAPAAYKGELGISQLMYQGVAPSRLAVAQGKYTFFAQQQCFLDQTLECFGPQDFNILNTIQTTAAQPQFLNFENFGQRAFFWATRGEMRVEKVNEFAYPTRVSPDPGFPAVDPGYPF